MPHRYFDFSLTPGAVGATLTGSEAHHFSAVMRGKAGADLLLCDGKGTDYAARVTAVEKDAVQLEILSFAPSVCEAGIAATIYVGYPKQDKLEMIIQKATELGAVRIVPFFSKFCVVTPKKEEQKNERYARIALEAAKQCGRGIIPAVSMPLSYKEMLADAVQNDVALFCYEAGGVPLHSRLNGVKSVGIITGSEGGFSPEEAAAAAEAGCASIGLGPRILRCETAPTAALAAVMTLTGNLQ